MVTGVSTGSVQNDHKMNPIARGAVLGGAIGLSGASYFNITGTCDNLRRLKKNLESHKSHLSRLKTQSVVDPKDEYTKKCIKECEAAIKNCTSKIGSAKKSMPKDIIKGIVTTPMLYLALLAGVGTGVVVNAVKNKKAQKAE